MLPRRRRPRPRTLSASAFLLALTAGCGDPAPTAVEVPPSVKTFVVGKQATGQSRRISGRVDAVDRSTLSFGVGGQVVEILAKEGEEVATGQLLARLDDEPLRLQVEDARATLGKARAAFIDAEAEFNRTQGLASQRAASQKDLDAATSRLASADGDVKAAQGALERAELDLAKARLTAPFAGRIAAVPVDPFQEVGGGTEIVTLQSDDALVVELLVPETLIRQVDYGQLVQVEFPTLEDVVASGTVSRIGATAEAGNAFPVKVRLDPTAADLRPGMTASVTFNFADYLDGRSAFLIPLSALAIDAAVIAGTTQRDGSRPAEAPLFVYDSQSAVVRYRLVRIGGLRGNEIEVFEGLEAGDRVASAGVAFLRDGMSVTLWEQRR